jgi:cell pole-organizing protein PopZ
VLQAAPPPMQATPARPLADSADRDLEDMLEDVEPLALSPSQIVRSSDEDLGGFSFDSILADTESESPAEEVPELVEPEDVGFTEAEAEDDLPSFDPAPMRATEPEPEPEPEPVLRVVQPQPAPAMPEPPRMSVAEAAPLPDPTLTSDMADELLEPATKAAVRSSIGKLSALGIGSPGLTIEAMMRDMLRPMLKEWLDEHLPSVVERMVEKEIARISRGE